MAIISGAASGIGKAIGRTASWNREQDLKVQPEEKHAMQAETLKPTAPASAAIVLAALMATTAIVAPAVAAPPREDGVDSAAPATTGASGAALSSAAGEAVRHITLARADLADSDVDAANRELGLALDLLDSMEASLPSGVATDAIRIARERLDYESAEQVIPDLVPIYQSLQTLGREMPVDEAREHVDRAKEHLERRNKSDARAELDAAGAALVYEEVDLPLNTTRRLVTQAREELRRNDTTAAEAALRAAEDNVVYLSVAVYEPLVEAHQSLWQAAQDYADGAYGAAKSEIDRAVGYLDHATHDADEETRHAAWSLSEKARSLKNEIEANSEDVPSRLTELWRRTKAVSERAVEYFTTGWERIGTESAVKADLIEAKLHLSYAETDRFVAHDAEKAASELGLALSYLGQAADHASTGQAPAIAAVRDGVEQLAAEPATVDMSRYTELKGDLSRMIEGRAESADAAVDGGIAGHHAEALQTHD